MSELELREFRTRAEELVELPEFAELEGRGRRRHRRRVTVGAALVVGVLAVVGVVVGQREEPRPAPIEPPDERNSGEVTYPGPVMETLDAGTYVLQPSLEDSAPRVRVTLPAGWNAWQGPNRFDGDLETTKWYAGLLVVDVTAVASQPCSSPRAGDEIGESPAALVEAIKRIPGLRVTAEEAPADLFGRPATQLQARRTPAFRACDEDENLFWTARNGVVIGGPETLTKAWVVDVEGQAILVDAGFTPRTPPEIQRELDAIVESIEFVDPD